MTSLLDTPSTVLFTDDLKVLERFHNAWCEENGVDKNDDRAVEVATALIEWYTADPKYRAAHQEKDITITPSPKIDELLQRIG